jgi:hypothetical protein
LFWAGSGGWQTGVALRQRGGKGGGAIMKFLWCARRLSHPFVSGNYIHRKQQQSSTGEKKIKQKANNAVEAISGNHRAAAACCRARAALAIVLLALLTASVI